MNAMHTLVSSLFVASNPRILYINPTHLHCENGVLGRILLEIQANLATPDRIATEDDTNMLGPARENMTIHPQIHRTRIKSSSKNLSHRILRCNSTTTVYRDDNLAI
jgi:hypothetical protein